jgi:hypothetical protein
MKVESTVTAVWMRLFALAVEKMHSTSSVVATRTFISGHRLRRMGKFRQFI